MKNKFFYNIKKTLNYGKNCCLSLVNQKGGALFDGSALDAFNLFIDNSEITILSNSSYSGLLLIATLNDNIPSPYTRYNTESFIKQESGNIRKICIKLVHMYNGSIGEQPCIYNYKINEDSKNESKKCDDVNAFTNEINIQNNIAIKTSNNFEMATPYIIYSNIYDYININLLEKILDGTKFNNFISKGITNRKPNSTSPLIGLIAMDYIENSKLVFDNYQKKKKYYWN